jgi:hypothetical protein
MRGTALRYAVVEAGVVGDDESGISNLSGAALDTYLTQVSHDLRQLNNM